MHTFFIAPTGFGVGLTSISLGLLRALERAGLKVGFFKPIAQQHPGDLGPERSSELVARTHGIRPPTPLSLAQVEQAVLNVARYDVFKLSEAVLAGQIARVSRMLDGLQAEGTAEVLVHWTLAEDIRSICRVRDAMAAGQPLPMALRAQRIWGAKEKLFERLLPRVTDAQAARLLQSAHAVDGIVKGLSFEGWPRDGWQALRRLAMDLATAARTS